MSSIYDGKTREDLIELLNKRNLRCEKVERENAELLKAVAKVSSGQETKLVNGLLKQQKVMTDIISDLRNKRAEYMKLNIEYKCLIDKMKGFEDKRENE